MNLCAQINRITQRVAVRADLVAGLKPLAALDETYQNRFGRVCDVSLSEEQVQDAFPDGGAAHVRAQLLVWKVAPLLARLGAVSDWDDVEQELG